MPQVISVAGLQKQAATYDKKLRVLPFFTLRQIADTLKLNIREVEGKHVIVQKRRNANITGPYSPEATLAYKPELRKFRESPLEIDLTYAATKDNIQNYNTADVVYMGGTKQDPSEKKHPLERSIIEDVVKSHSEDVASCLFFADRDPDVNTPMTAFNGLYTQEAALRLAGEINIASGNYRKTGAFVGPSGDTDVAAYGSLVEFIGGGSNTLRSSNGGAPVLYASQTVLKAARDAFRNKVKTFKYPTLEEMLESLREDSFCPGLQIATHEALGSGSKLMLMKPNNMELGWNSQKAAQFVQVRDPFEDPNMIQFWLQAAYGTRIIEIHPKVFMTNEQSNSATMLRGDYIDLGAITMTVTGATGAAWRVKGTTEWLASGDYAVGLTPGNVVIEFKEVALYTTPADKTVVAKAGLDVAATQAYTLA